MCSVKKGILKNFVIFTGKHLFWSLFFARRPANLLKKDSNTVVFHMNIAKFLRTTILKNFCEWLLGLYLQNQSTGDVLQNRCFWNFYKVHRKAVAVESLLLIKRHWYRCFPRNFVKFFTASFLIKLYTHVRI